MTTSDAEWDSGYDDLVGSRTMTLPRRLAKRAEVLRRSAAKTKGLALSATKAKGLAHPAAKRKEPDPPAANKQEPRDELGSPINTSAAVASTEWEQTKSSSKNNPVITRTETHLSIPKMKSMASWKAFLFV